MSTRQELIDQLSICAYCPNACRATYTSDRDPQIESQTPSALSLVALAVLKGQIPLDDDTRRTLARRGAARASRGHCVYGLDIPALLDEVLALAGH